MNSHDMTIWNIVWIFLDTEPLIQYNVSNLYYEYLYLPPLILFVCVGVLRAQSTTRSCRAGQLIVVLFLGRLRPSKWLTSTKRGHPRR